MEKFPKWTASNIPSQQGRSAIVTGTGGIGYETALELAKNGAEVILAGRNAAKGAESVKKIRSSVPSANIRFEELDLASLESVQAFGARMNKERHSLDLLINNAGVMTPPTRKITKDGFELQFGTNYLGHFALTAHLMPLLRKGNKPRVISLGSVAHRSGSIHFDDLQFERRYHAMKAYAQSKIAMIMFALELQRRSDASGWGLLSLPAHPGVSRTELILNGSGPNSSAGMLRRLLGPVFFQPAAQGALPTLFAATSPDAKSGTYYGPGRLSETRGLPKPGKIAPQGLDAAVAARLWEVSIQLTHVDFDAIANS
ncbi:SDR family NAD(P)-dependent oxidoreductase [Paenibacillus sp. LMG 31459]|uniref:SDR family NAD(P)-dependent oxidoreductase n=1 Tax=Paenibacillus phytohabitans TaxID=2654978 RepID=A0ABX1YDW6_9BACL|nr:SDR family oxidoreductase [Paenibacillus phytohabitans]NOU78083.1 SDR family NAD(P)-dependent oxidoreductase [Paenibacillus phytohabitans]